MIEPNKKTAYQGITLSYTSVERMTSFFERYAVWIITVVLSVLSVIAFVYYYQNGLGLAYNDARSHLDIGRRLVEGLNTGMGQLGSVWLPLVHILIGITVWNDFMWHSGLAGALWSMIAYVMTGILIYLSLREIGATLLGRFVGVAVFALNLNIIYLQSTAMTELVLLATMSAGAYYFIRWFKTENMIELIKTAFFVMIATLVRYDGWFMFFFAALLIAFFLLRQSRYREAEGIFVLFSTLAGFGIFLWLLWNALIFKDPLYFAFGPYSAHSQQLELEDLGDLPTKWHWFASARVYYYAMAYSVGVFSLILSSIGMVMLWLDRKISPAIRLASLILLAPLLFNIIALYLGHSVLSLPGLSGPTWFNVRYGIMMMPSIAIFVGYLFHRAVGLRSTLFGLLIFVTFFQFTSYDAVTVDDAIYGSSQKNVSEVSGWLREYVTSQPGLILISSVSHDAVIFSSGLPMKRFIHEGSGVYYDEAIAHPDLWARWIVVHTGALQDSTWRLLHDNPGFAKYDRIGEYPFADIYQLREEYQSQLKTNQVLDQMVPALNK